MELVTRNKILIGILVALIITFVSTVSYAYFTSMAEIRKQDTTLSTGTMRLKFSDNDSGVNATLNYGEKAIKKLKIENIGTLDAYATIYFDKLVNTYTKGSFTYDLEYSESENGSYTKMVSDRSVPNSEVEMSTALEEDILIPAGNAYYFNLIFKLNYLSEVNQTNDSMATFRTQFSLKEGGKKLTATQTLTALNYQSKGSVPSLESSVPTRVKYSIVEDYNEKILERAVEKYTVDDNSFDVPEFYLLYSDSYDFDSDVGEFTLVNPQIKKYKEIFSDLSGKYVRYTNPVPLSDVESHREEFSKNSYIFKIENATYDNETNSGTITYRSIYRTEVYNPLELFETRDDYGTSYYVRGVGEKNYVSFAGFYWRILRINGDGTLRIMYDGTSIHENDDSSTDRYIGLSGYSTNHNDNAFLGYKNGSVPSTLLGEAKNNLQTSTIETYLNSWYRDNIVSKQYAGAVADAIFCNDRSTFSGDGIGTNETTYTALNRITNKTPSLICSDQNDRFTVSDSVNGNARLMYPIGLATADEIMLAGENELNYIYRSKYYWTMTPAKYTEAAGNYYVANHKLSSEDFYYQEFCGDKCPINSRVPDNHSISKEKEELNSYYRFNDGSIIVSPPIIINPTPVCVKNPCWPGKIYYNLTEELAVVPVINIKTEYLRNMTGTGTSTDPFVISVN